MLWGGNPVMSHPVAARDIMTGRRNGAKLIVVDPRFTEIAAKADLFLQPRPATDDALALAILHVLILEELYDQEFVAKWCVGFDELRNRIREYPPQRVAEITGIPGKRSSCGQNVRRPSAGDDAHPHGHVDEHQCHSNRPGRQPDPGALRDIDIKGGHIMANRPPGLKGRRDILGKDFRQPAEIEEKRIGAKEFPLLCGSQSLALNNSHPLP